MRGAHGSEGSSHSPQAENAQAKPPNAGKPEINKYSKIITTVLFVEAGNYLNVSQQEAEQINDHLCSSILCSLKESVQIQSKLHSSVERKRRSEVVGVSAARI